MELSGIRRPTESPAGGEILRDANGDATGLLRETAQRLIKRGAGEPAPTAGGATARARKVLELASQEALVKGITTFEDAGSPLATIDLMKKMVDEGKLGVRLWVMVRAAATTSIAPKLAQYKMIDYGNGHLTVRAIKKQIDGALGSRGAWLLEPYADKPDSARPEHRRRSPTSTRPRSWRMQNGFQLCVHAIGDRANRETLDIFERAFKANPAKKDLRWRVEHAQHLSAQDIPRFGKLGVIASMQGIHCTSDAPYVLAAPRREARRGRRLRLAEADEDRRDRRQRHRRAGRGRRSDPELTTRRVSRKLEGRHGVLPGPAHVADGGAAVLHDQRRLRRVRGEQPRLARRAASTPTSPSCRRTS